MSGRALNEKIDEKIRGYASALVASRSNRGGTFLCLKMPLKGGKGDEDA
jgi:hypothetical protein